MFDMALIDECKNINVPTQIVRAIVKEESSSNILSVNVNHEGKSLVSYKPKTKDEAIQLANSWINKGYAVDLGLMQLNSENFDKFNIKTNEALNPCTNIKVASTIYYNFFKKLNTKIPYKKRVQMALSGYNTGDYKKGFNNGYVAKYDKHLDFTDNKNVKEYAKYLLSIKFPSSLVATY